MESVSIGVRGQFEPCGLPVRMQGWMATPERGERRPERRWRLLAIALVVLGALDAAPAGIAAEATIEPAEYASSFSWRPATASIAPGGTVAFRNPGKVVPHGLAWTSGPEKPSCSGVPVDGSGTEWSGSCAFAQAGTYTFVCTVHPEEMKGTITVGSDPTTPSPAPGYGQPSNGSEAAFKGLRMARNQHGDTVHGSLAIAPYAEGGKLTVELWARRSALGTGRGGSVRVGRTQQAQLKVGRTAFELPLTASARRTLLERERLPLTVKIAVKPPGGPRSTASRGVELRG